ncbi:hypothetical protein FW774_07955 [Pedobacter sp. BS3]|uniref:hypothetical protein n=1 Tax=Pedobacter sp. BS3 TaxID=2567937 RepID=UPI0011F02F8F|nr:hypothetical protein [Pedobacter sp. BS3]TZF84898.1 hypothetical protein FW774_07955 [Pedobacter sp. BS3]
MENNFSSTGTQRAAVPNQQPNTPGNGPRNPDEDNQKNNNGEPDTSPEQLDTDSYLERVHEADPDDIEEESQYQDIESAGKNSAEQDAGLESDTGGKNPDNEDLYK